MGRNKKAPGSFERRGGFWRWDVYVGGKRFKLSTSFTVRQDAEDWAREQYKELQQQGLRYADGLPVGKTFGDLLTYFEKERLGRLAPGTQEAYRDSLKPIKAWFAQHALDALPLARIRKTHIGDYLDWRFTHRGVRGTEWWKGAGDATNRADPRTVAKDRALLHRLFSVAQERDWCEGNPVTKVEAPSGDGRQYIILTAEQYDALLQACGALPTDHSESDQVQLYVLFCGETGARSKSEALWLRWEDVDFEAGFVQIVSGRDGHRVKGGKTRSVPMTPRLTAALREHFAAHRFAAYNGERPEYVFHHTRSRRHYQAGVRVKNFQGSVEAAARNAVLPDEWVMHDLRHRRVTTWLTEGKPLVTVQKAVGHADVRTTMGYLHLVREDLRVLVEQNVGSWGDFGGIGSEIGAKGQKSPQASKRASR